MKNINQKLLLTLFAAYTVKVLALGANPTDAAIILVLAASHFLYSSQIQNTEIFELKQNLSKLSNELEQLKTETKELKTNIAGVKIASGLRPVGSK